MTCELDRVDGLQVRLVTPAFDARGEPELLEQLGELAGREVDHLEVPLFRLADDLHAHERLGEAVDRGQRRAQVVRGERDQPRELCVGIHHRAGGH